MAITMGRCRPVGCGCYSGFWIRVMNCSLGSSLVNSPMTQWMTNPEQSVSPRTHMLNAPAIITVGCSDGQFRCRRNRRPAALATNYLMKSCAGPHVALVCPALAPISRQTAVRRYTRLVRAAATAYQTAESVPHSAYHWDGRKGRFFERWYFKVSEVF